jgi:peptide deformylase
MEQAEQILKIHQAGSPVLRMIANPIGKRQIRGQKIRHLIEQMRETLRDAPGVGLAAPQVGVALQLAVIEDREQYHMDLSSEQLAARGRKAIPFHVLINPGLTVVDPGPILFFEGCLSLSGYTAVTPRAAAVRVKALNERGDPVEIVADGWYARILQHEIDHLNGRLYIDHMLTTTFMTTLNYQRVWSQRTLEDVCAECGSPLG